MRPKTYRGWWLCVCELIISAIFCWLLGHICEDFFHLYSSRRMVHILTPYQNIQISELTLVKIISLLSNNR
jgi:hypothetical protein